MIETTRLNLIIASLILACSIVIAAFMLAPNRYAALSHINGGYIRLDQRTGEIIQCTYEKECVSVDTSSAKELKELDDLMANVAKEVGGQ